MISSDRSIFQTNRWLFEPDGDLLSRLVDLAAIFRLLALAIMLVLCSAPSSATDYRFSPVKKANGQRTLKMQMVTQQRNGLIWIGTEDGVSRYDGRHFQHLTYRSSNLDALSNNMVTGIAEDAINNVWVGTEFGLNKIAPDGKITQYLPQHGNFDAEWVMSLYSDNQQQLWIGSDKSLSRYDPSSDSFTYYPAYGLQGEPLDDVGFTQMATLASGEVVVASTSGLIKLDQQRQSFHLIPTEDETVAKVIHGYLDQLFLTQDERLLLTSEEFGAYWYDPRTKQVKTALTGIDNDIFDPTQITSVMQLDSGQLWIGTYQGLFIFDADGVYLEQINREEFNQQSLPSDFILNLYQDQSGLIWVATDNGLVTYSGLQSPSFLHHKRYNKNSLADHNINSLLNTDDGTVWTAGYEGYSKIDQGSRTVTNFDTTEFEQDPGILQLVQGVSHTLWYAGLNGIGTIDSHSGKLTHYSNQADNPHGLPNTNIYTVLPDEHGGVWYTGYFDTGLGYFHPDTGVGAVYLKDNHPYSDMGNYSFNTIWGNDGNIWMATTDSVYRVDPATGESVYFPMSQSREYIRTSDIVNHPSGDLWLATLGAGLVQLKHVPNEVTEKQYQTILVSAQLGLEERSFKALTVDKLDPNIIWFVSQDLLYQLNIEQQTITSYPSLFAQQDLVFMDAAITQVGERLFLGSNNGVFEVDTRKLSTNKFEPNVIVTSVRSNGMQLVGATNSILQKPSIKYEHNTVEFNFSALDYTAPYRNRYRYRLAGADADWVYAEGTTSVTYTNLGAGDYHFIVEGTNSDGIWSPKQGHWYFTIAMAWWSWALIILSLIVITMVMYYLQKRSEKIDFLSRIAFKDALTGLANRRQFIAWLDKLCQQKTQTHHFSVVFIDLDNFKHINDSFGHGIGDQYIGAIAQQLSNSLRPSDKIARLGGDEFAVLLYGELSQEQSDHLVEQLMQVIGIEHALGDQIIQGSASIGIARYPSNGNDSSTLLKNADTAMYAAKRRGKKVFSYYDDQQSQQLRHEFALSNEIFHAISHQQIHVFYQAKVCCKTGEVKGAEALARWIHPQRGMVSPADFIPIAEANGAIIKMGQRILAEACLRAQIWHEAGLLNGPISVNVSARELRQKNYVAMVLQTLEQTGLPPHMLDLELTESLLVENIALAREVIIDLRSHGIRISLDDFGTGYSSLSYLEELPIDTLKIDRSFINKVSGLTSQSHVLLTILELSRRLGLEIVAEGVETQQQLQYLQQYNCHLAQGFLFSKPVDSWHFSELLRQQTTVDTFIAIEDTEGKAIPA